MKAFYFLFVLSFFITNSLFAQFKEGYIVKNNNDTIHGLIEYEGPTLNSEHCNFKSLKDSRINKYYPGDIKAFRFTGSKYFTTSTIPVDSVPHKVFLEWLIKGKASVLAYSPSNTVTRFFILLANDSLLELQNTVFTREVKGFHDYTFRKEYIGTLSYYFKDCPSVFPAIERSFFTRNSLIKVTKMYNEKVGDNKGLIVFEKNSMKLKWEIGPSFSLLSSQLKFGKDQPENAYPSNSMGYGVSLKISGFSAISNYTVVSKLSFSTQIMYYSLLYKCDITGLPYYFKEEKLCKIQYIRIPWQVNYKFSNKKFTPFISLGATTDFRTGHKMYDQYLIDYVTTHPGYHLGMKFFQAGINSGIGFEYAITPKVTINAKAEYERAVRFFGTYPQDNSYNNNTIIQASVLYRIK
jgi:hypothetical protein